MGRKKAKLSDIKNTDADVVDTVPEAPVVPTKEVEKIVEKEYDHHYVRPARVEALKKFGWEVVGQTVDKRTHVADLVLMRKEK